MATVVEPKKTAKKAKPAAVYQALAQMAESPYRERRRISLSALRRHPDNRQPTEAAIGDVAASFERLGQLEAVIVRPLFGDTFEVISGETRWRAAERLGWPAIDCEVRQLTDSEALQVLAAANASRQDLSPIDKAKLIVRLCQPKSEGGGGLTREAAALMFDLQSGGAASNLVRLLELPECWQQRVASGELPQTFARELVRLVGIDERAWVEIEEEWSKWSDGGERTRYSTFASREELAHDIDRTIDEWSRVVEKGDKQNPEAWRDAVGWEPRPVLFKITPELETELRIVDVVLYGEKTRRATNVTLYDAFQIPAIKAHVAKQRSKSGGGRESSRDKTPAESLTPAQRAADEKRRREEADEKLKRRICDWRLAWLRELCARAIVAPARHDLAVRICMWLQSQVAVLSYKNLEDLAIDSFLQSAWRSNKDAWTGAIGTKAGHGAEQLVAHWLRIPDRDGQGHPFSGSKVIDLASLLKIDLDHEWLTLQSGTETDERFREFFELHNGEQLDELGGELGVHVADAKTKAIKVQRLTTRDRILKLPKSLRLKELSGKAGA